MDLADTPRQGDLNGRGNLSQKALVEFVAWFCGVALDQLQFMNNLFDLNNLEERLDNYILRELRFPKESSVFVKEVMRRGEVPRGEASRVMSRPERTARQLLRNLTDSGILGSSTPKGPVHILFSTSIADILFPRLFPAA